MSYQDVVEHRGMVFDGKRNAAYTRAMKKVITSDTTVMDLGAGLGIHGLIAARLGAAKVYLVEPTAVLEVARTVAANNQLDAVECIRANAETLQLDTRVDLIVSAFTGNFLLSEDLLPSLFYARDHYLAPGGRLIPDCGRMEVVPVAAPAYYDKYVASWSDFPKVCREQGVPELDYSALRTYAANYMRHDSAKNMQAQRLAEPATLLELDFNTATKAECDSHVEVTIQYDGVCHGWIGWFQMRLLDEWLSTDGENSKTHWSQVFMPLAQPLVVTEGDHLTFHLKRPELGEWTWTTSLGAQRQRQSSFLSRPISREDLQKQASNYRPALNAEGEAAQWVLARMTGDVPVEQLASELQRQHSARFKNISEAMRFVRQIVERFG
jgi:SAM-dependent methyltransferase